MAVLYRKYRPQTFSDVLGQKAIVQTLKNQVLAGSVAHAYLFTGSRGVGKTSVARILAKAVNCVGSTQQTVDNKQIGDACGVCENCKAIAAGSFLDLVEVDAASNTGVDNIRELIEHVKFSPSLGKYKVFIIDEVHMLSKGAFNALLKTLEEPPSHTIFVLATTEINKVPATIISRTQRFDFKALDSNDLLKHLEKVCGRENVNFAPGVLEMVAQNAQGSVRDALSLLDKVLTLGQGASLSDFRALLGVTDENLCFELLNLIAQGEAQKLPDLFSAISEQGTDFVIFNRDFLEFLRKVLVFKIAENKTESAVDFQKLAANFSAQDLIFITRLFLKSYKDLQTTPEPQIPMLLAGLEAALRKGSREVKSELQEKLFFHEPIVTIDQSINEGVKMLEIANRSYESISLEEVTGLWPKVINEVKELNGPLSSMMRGAKLHSVEQGILMLEVKFLFDKQNLENPKNTALVTAVFEELSGKKIGMKARVIKAEIRDNLVPGEAIKEALQVFGGELVE